MKMKKSSRRLGSTQSSGKSSADGEKPDTEVPRPKGKTSWRIQEAHKVFALMREEYEKSKKLFVLRRYRELERILEMFTADPVLEKLRYLSTPEAKVRHRKALETRTSMASITSSSNSKTNSSSNNSSSPCVSATGTGSTSTSSTPRSCRSICGSRMAKSDQSTNRITPGNTKTQPIWDLEDSNNKSSVASSFLFPIDNTKKAESLYWRRNRNNAAFKSTATVLNTPLDHPASSPKDFLKRPSENHHKSAASLYVPTNSSDLGTTFTNSVENIGQACSRAYNFLSEKVSRISRTELDFKVSTGSLRPLRVSMETALHRATKEYRRRQRAAANTASVRAFYFPDTASAHSSPALNPLRRARKSSCPQQERTKVTADSGWLKTQAPPSAKSSATACKETLQRTLKSPACRLNVNRSSENPRESPLTSPTSQKSCRVFTFDAHLTPRAGHDRRKSSSRSNFSGLSEGRLSPRQKERKSSHVVDLAEHEDAILDSIVLTIAQDNITNLRAEFRALQGMNKLKRYKRMKDIIKSCMNVLKSD